MPAKKDPAAKKDPVDKKELRRVEIKAPNFQIAEFPLVSTAPLMMNTFPAKAREQIRAKQEGGGPAANRKERAPKDFEALYEESKHISTKGWLGWPCAAFRSAMISVCRLTGYPMTRGKMAIFVLADGYKDDGTPLVRMLGEPRMSVMWARNDDRGVDLRSRAMFDEWEMLVRVEYDADQFAETDIANLMLRAGRQNGIGDGRPNSPNSNGMGFGTFTIKGASRAAQGRSRG